VRIVGGSFAGRWLTSPGDQRVRPTAEPVRVGLMEALLADLKDARVLDLFAGTGALGLEAISRGAKQADFVEFQPASLHALKANVAALKLGKRTRIFKKDAIPFVEALPADSYDLAFADPPYESKVLDRLLKYWRATAFAPVLAVEHARSHGVPQGAQRLVFEDTVVTIYRR
jgi:16S rRNA (guanine966-N2)-methyltransferase